MDLWQWIVLIFLAMIALVVLSIIFLALYHVHQDQQYKRRSKYGPKTKKEVEELAEELLAQIIENRKRDNTDGSNNV